jgi:hypothetical protein
MKSGIQRFIFLAWFIMLTTWHTSAQDEKFKAIFIYNFTKYIEWPKEQESSEFIIIVLGNNSIVPELKNIAGRMKVGSKPIIIKYAQTFSAVTSANIVFIAKEMTGELPGLIESLNSKHILLITEKTNACNLGSAINFTQKNGNLNFEISPANILKAGLKVNSQLFTLGTVIQ